MKRYTVISLEATHTPYNPPKYRLTGSYGTYDKEEEAEARRLELESAKSWRSSDLEKTRHCGVAVITRQDIWEAKKQEKWHAVITYQMLVGNNLKAEGFAYASKRHAEKVAANAKAQDPIVNVGVLPVRM